MVNAWIEFVKKTKKSYPKMNLKEVLKMIKRKKLYKKTASAAKKAKKKTKKAKKKKAKTKKAKTRKAKTRKRNTRIKLVKQRKGRCPKGYKPYIEQPGSKMKKRCVEK